MEGGGGKERAKKGLQGGEGDEGEEEGGAGSILHLVAYLRAGMSSQPTRLGRPVVVPYSLPTSRKVSAASPKISVG